MKTKAFAAALAVVLAYLSPAQAQDFPNRPITLVVPFAAGGPQDVIGRLLANRMTELLGQKVVVENLGGGGGSIGSKRVADAKPDGYTMVMGTVGTHAQNQTLYKHPKYNSVTDFTPVAFIVESPIAVIVRKDLPVNSFKEFVAYTRQHQKEMSYGSGGAGSATHLACLVLDTGMGTKMSHIPYRGGALAMQDLYAGRIDLYCENVATARGSIEGGKVKGLALMTKERTPALPNLPTTFEQGYDIQAYTWSALFLPKGAPDDVVKKLNAAAEGAVNTPAVRERLQALGGILPTKDQQSPQWLANFVKSEIEKWAAPIKASGVQID